MARIMLDGAGVLSRDPVLGIDQRSALLMRMPADSVCAEIGVYRGEFSARIIRAVRPKTLHLIDPWRFEGDPLFENSLYGGRRGQDQAAMDAIFESITLRFAADIAARKVRIHRSQSAPAATGFPDEYFDWIYVDGNHLYEFVKADLHSFFPKIKSGGFITGDDFGLAGWWGDGVTRAVEEFVSEGQVRVEAMLGSQYILRKLR